MAKSYDAEVSEPAVDLSHPAYHEIYPDGIDPDDVPDGITELFVSPKRATKCYHLRTDCDRLRGNYDTRRAAVAAAWYPPCRYCVTDEFPRSSDDYQELREQGKDFDWGNTVSAAEYSNE